MRFLLVLGLVAPTLAAETPLGSQAIFEQAEPAIFQIRVIHRETGKKSSIGSGFVYGASNRLATNYHVVSSYIEEPAIYTLRYLGSGGREGELSLVGVDAVHDLALVEADATLGDPLQIADPPPKGAGVFAMGNPLDLGLTLAAWTNGGLLDQTDGSRILFSGSLNPGMSGGPTFDERGRVIGINVATARNDISFIVPTRYLRRIERHDGDIEKLSTAISQQIARYQRRYLDRISAGDWPATRLRGVQVPGAVSPTVRCWDASPTSKPDHLYRRFTISCKNENEIFLSDRLEVGKILYEFLWLESDSLSRPRFFRLYQSLNVSQFSSRASDEEVHRFRCDTRFVDVNGRDFKTTLCRRSYKLYPDLSDLLFTAAMTGHAGQGFIFNLDLYGTDFEAALELIRRFLKEIRWPD